MWTKKFRRGAQAVRWSQVKLKAMRLEVEWSLITQSLKMNPLKRSPLSFLTRMPINCPLVANQSKMKIANQKFAAITQH
jgi:hypothetical protein